MKTCDYKKLLTDIIAMGTGVTKNGDYIPLKGMDQEDLNAIVEAWDECDTLHVETYKGVGNE